MSKHPMPGNDRVPGNDRNRKNQPVQDDRSVQGRQRDDRSDTQRMGSNENPQRQSPGRGDEGKGRDSGDDRR